MMDSDVVYPVILHIPRTRDSRHLVYDISVIKNEGSTVDKDATALASFSDGRASATHKNESEPAVKSIEPSGEKLTQPMEKVKNESMDVKTEAEIAETQMERADRDLEAVDTLRFGSRDTSSVPADISDFVDTSLQDRRSNLQKEIAAATSPDNKAIHRLGPQYNGHYDGALRTATSNYIRHVINNHGDPVTEALCGQLHMDGDAIKITLSRLQSGQGRVIGKGESIRENPTIITEIPINGYTRYVGEPVAQLSGTDLEGRTMFMTPTSTKALLPTKTASIPKRRCEGHKVIIDGKKRIVNNFPTDASGNVLAKIVLLMIADSI